MGYELKQSDIWGFAHRARTEVKQKAGLKKRGLKPEEYQRRIKKLCARLGI